MSVSLKTKTPMGQIRKVRPMSDAKKTRASRTNHQAATANPITDANSAQVFADAALAATANDEKTSTMFNGSGFVSPAQLDEQPIDNLVRMGASIINSIAKRVSAGGESGTAAQNGLNILVGYGQNAGAIQQRIADERLVAEAEAARKRLAATR